MKRILNISILFIFTIFLFGCNNNNNTTTTSTTTSLPVNTHLQPTGVYYEIFVRSFSDSNNDGIGDFNGITAKLDYLEDLGIKGIWLMPINTSNTYHGYDVVDYYNVESDYGTMDDFENLLEEAHKRGIKVIIDLVLNHSSSENEWFNQSKNPESEYRDWYTWIDPNTDPRRFHAGWVTYLDEAYFAHFGGSMPDLNYSNQEVKDEAVKIGTYWLEKGVDGFRLDAAPFIFASGETIFDKPEKNIEFWNEFRTEMRKVKSDVYLVGEVWLDYTVYSQYYQGLDSTFNFELASYIINTARTGGQYANKLKSYYDGFKQYDPLFIDAPFLSNHDQDRVASVLQYYPEAHKMVAEMLLTLPGNPFLYYGEELGMPGIESAAYDETRRLPFNWGDDYTTSWRSTTGYDDYDAFALQSTNPNSLYNTYKTLINLRNDHIALSLGEFYPYQSTNPRMQGFYRVHKEGDNEQLVLVLHNFSTKDTYDLPELANATLLYQSYGKTGYNSNKLSPSTTIIVELPYSDLSKYINE